MTSLISFLAVLAALTCTAFSSAVRRSTDDSALCSYSFNVLASTGETCPSGPSADSLTELKNAITAQHADLEAKLDFLLSQLASNQTSTEDNGGGTGGGGGSVNYKRWGRTTCPDTATLVYEGVMGKSHYDQGGGVNYLCLPKDPEFPDDVQAGLQTGAYIWGVEYETWNSQRFFYSMKNHDAPCAVCEVQGRNQVLMIPAKKTCPDGWTLEYEGILASDHYQHKHGAEFVCVSGGIEASHSGNTNENGGTLNVVEARCGSLPCPPYTEGYELSCVVCTK